MMKRNKCIILLGLAGMAFASCDDGHVDDPVYVDPTKTYSVVVTGTYHGKDQWTGGDYNLCLAGFKDDSEYSVIQKDYDTKADTQTPETMRMTRIPTTCTSIQVAVVNVLRQHQATIYKYEIDASQDPDDTIRIDLGNIDVSMFGAVNSAVFQGLSCSKCHQGSEPTAGLNLETDKAYANLVGVESSKGAGATRVIAGDAESSFLYKVLAEGDANVHYSHLGFFVEDDNVPLLPLIKAWIDEGAKE